MQQNEEKEFYKLLRTAWSCSIYFLWFCGDQTIKSRGQNKYRSQLLHGMQNGGIPILIVKSVYLIATRDLSNLWLQFFLSQNQGFMRLFEKTVLK